jgi:hypothetical protein
MTINKKYTKNTIFIICLIVLAFGWRIINHNYQFAPNLELVTAVSVLSAIIFGWRIALIVPITTMIISDIIIGNSSIFIFTWGSFAIIGLSAVVLRKLNTKPKIQILSSVGFAVASTFLFFVITNFGVWLQGWYPMTWAGLVDCFVMAIPFYRTMLIGNIILVPSAVIVWQVVRSRQIVKSLVINSLVGK